MKKHKFNIFPEAKPEDYNEIKDDIAKNGFDPTRAITLYQGEIIDGWNRQRACDELGIKPSYVTFQGSDSDAIDFVMSTNRRRNLNSGQKAAVAADYEDLIKAIREEVERERIEKQKANAVNRHTQKQVHEAENVLASDNKLSEVRKDEHANTTSTKIAKLFNTNRTYVNQAVKMKEQAPEVFERVKAGKMTMQDANKAVRAIPTDPWMEDEKQRKQEVEAGHTVVANQQRDKNLIAWAEKNGKAVRVDRGSLYGNPFVLGQDGDRDAVCDAYRDHYLPHKPSILKTLPSLRGKVLICHCYPDRCHAHSLIR